MKLFEAHLLLKMPILELEIASFLIKSSFAIRSTLQASLQTDLVF